MINYLTVHPQMAFTLSELSSALGVSPASMSSILLALSEWGYVLRDRRHRTYALGPAVVAAGHAASQRHPVIEAARPELRRLSTFGSECIGSAAVAEEILILAIEGRPSSQSREAWIGQRVPLIPPFGQVFLAWAPEADVQHWLGRLGPDGAARHGRELVEDLLQVRGRGVAIGLRNEQVDTVIGLINESAHRLDKDAEIHRALQRAIPDQTDNYSLRAVDPGARYDVANLAAPVFGPDGTVAFAMTLYGINDIPGSDLLELCSEMLQSGRTVTRAIGGRWAAHMPESIAL
ncbi:helix-turn-helix domain-containing protein [Arthrobacter sp. E918]|uniref:Helix-turn-helix domain-containing protein n=1 Tax=Arthrobacter mobilis TaxID=2724944 RepID=A0A7X6K4Z0_9MICC|nr:helix-turn-helix domain-containing protein [Arthrobacter mobilis]